MEAETNAILIAMLYLVITTIGGVTRKSALCVVVR